MHAVRNGTRRCAVAVRGRGKIPIEYSTNPPSPCVVRAGQRLHQGRDSSPPAGWVGRRMGRGSGGGLVAGLWKQTAAFPACGLPSRPGLPPAAGVSAARSDHRRGSLVNGPYSSARSTALRSTALRSAGASARQPLAPDPRLRPRDSASLAAGSSPRVPSRGYLPSRSSPRVPSRGYLPSRPSPQVPRRGYLARGAVVIGGNGLRWCGSGSGEPGLGRIRRRGGRAACPGGR
jgi:hypothetical protein